LNRAVPPSAAAHSARAGIGSLCRSALGRHWCCRATARDATAPLFAIAARPRCCRRTPLQLCLARTSLCRRCNSALSQGEKEQGREWLGTSSKRMNGGWEWKNERMRKDLFLYQGRNQLDG